MKNISNFYQYLKPILRILIGSIFLFSSISKLLTIDEFEIYIHSFHLFNFVTITIFSRLLIAAELLIGIFLITKTFYKYTWYGALLFLFGFTLFLCYVSIFRNDDNCHCFGSLIEVNPIHSIIKNAIMILLLLPIRKLPEYSFSRKKWIISLSIVSALLVPFCLFPANTIYNKFVSPIREINQPVYDDFMLDSAMQTIDLQNGNYIMAFYVSGCKYCKMSMKKIKTIFEYSDLDVNKLPIVIIGNDSSVVKFQNETETTNYRYYPYKNEQVRNILKIPYGNFPTFIFIENGIPIKAVDFHGLNENEIIDFIKD